MKIPASTKRMIAVVPEIWFSKYKPVIKIATSILTTLSAVPIFFFIVCFANELIQHKNQPIKVATQLLLLHKGNFISAQVY